MMGWDNRFGWGAMHGGGMIWMLVVALLVVVPFWKLLPRSGIPAWVAILAVIPFVAVILLWIAAFKTDDSGKGSGQ